MPQPWIVLTKKKKKKKLKESLCHINLCVTKQNKKKHFSLKVINVKSKHGCTIYYLGLFLKGWSTSLHFLVSTSSSHPSPGLDNRGESSRNDRCNKKLRGKKTFLWEDIFLLIGLQSTLRPPNRNKELSDTAVSVCQDLPTGALDTGTLENIFNTTQSIKSYEELEQFEYRWI